MGGTTTAVWQSPPFTYSGVPAEPMPASISFALDRRANVDQLLAVAGNSAEYSVRLIDLSAGGERRDPDRADDPGRRRLLDQRVARLDRSRAASRSATNTGSRSPAATPAGPACSSTGSADYDNVVLSAVDGQRRQAAKAAKAKAKAAAAAARAAAPSSSQRLEELLRQATPGTAMLDDGKRLLVRVKCPRKVGPPAGRRRRAC